MKKTIGFHNVEWYWVLGSPCTTVFQLVISRDIIDHNWTGSLLEKQKL